MLTTGTICQDVLSSLSANSFPSFRLSYPPCPLSLPSLPTQPSSIRSPYTFPTLPSPIRSPYTLPTLPSPIRSPYTLPILPALSALPIPPTLPSPIRSPYTLPTLPSPIRSPYTLPTLPSPIRSPLLLFFPFLFQYLLLCSGFSNIFQAAVGGRGVGVGVGGWGREIYVLMRWKA